MATNLTDVSAFTSPVVAPADGDSRNAASIVQGEQPLANRTRFLLNAILTRLAWSGDFSVASGGSLTSFSIGVGAIAQLVAADSNGVYWAASAAAGTVTQAHVEGGGATLGASAQWWYVYAYVTTLGVVSYAVSTTAPDASRRFKGADPTRAYLGCFRTLSTGAPIPVRAVGGRYLTRISALASSVAYQALDGITTGTATTFTDVDLSGFIPPHARVVLIEIAPNIVTFNVDLRTNGETASFVTVRSLRQVVEIETDASRIIEYRVGDASQSIEGNVLGFVE